MATKSVRFSLGTVEQLEGGKVAKEFHERIEELIKDIESRPHLKTAREVSLIVKLRPAEVDQGCVEQIDAELAVKFKKPAFQRTWPMKVGARQQLLFPVGLEGEDPREKSEGDA